MSTQKENIKAHLIGGNKITPIIAMTDFGCMRLAAVIFTLREDGMDIATNNITRNGKTFAQYSLVTEKPMLEVVVKPRYPSGNSYANDDNNIHLCGNITRSYINGTEEPGRNVFIQLSEGITLQMT